MHTRTDCWSWGCRVFSGSNSVTSYSLSMMLNQPILHDSKTDRGVITVVAEETVAAKSKVKFAFRATNLDRKDFFGFGLSIFLRCPLCFISLQESQIRFSSSRVKILMARIHRFIKPKFAIIISTDTTKHFRRLSRAISIHSGTNLSCL